MKKQPKRLTRFVAASAAHAELRANGEGPDDFEIPGLPTEDPYEGRFRQQEESPLLRYH